MTPHAAGRASAQRYVLEGERASFTWKAYLRSTGSLGRRWLRRKARHDWMAHRLASDVDLVTFWLDERVGGGGTGVCLSVFCHGYEVLRFDCFGPDLGHFHVAPFTPWGIFGMQERRVNLPEPTVEQQIERSLFEITENLDFYLQLNPRRCIRKIRINRTDRLDACNAARERLHDHMHRISLLKP